ncbi:LacI family transcriptional regulator [Marinobacterium nitratireducens]|uniref:LacI family transcriptional regulator n=1 Tax=Marinobacterium nitratireducens TaxID=518897 RepID=A0A918DWX1_9GAMM|nr:LacI family DNA-binding transcriptional regulator [Marinobacterium nitratireducens]GGO86297.1 LacI family transcriptional regulator [Marinobacterium nitratireducens]
MSAKKVTLRDIAEHLGVNTSTVSRALNPKTSKMLTAEQVRRVQEAADALGYVQNTMAYALKKGRSMTIGVIIPDLMNPVFPPILKGIMNYLNREAYTSIIAYSENDMELALTEIKRMKGRQVDGFILAGAFRDDFSVDYCVDNNIPAITVGRSVDKDVVDKIVIDNESGMQQMVEHLLELGHRRIALIAAPQNISDGYERYRAYLEQLESHGIEVDESLIVQAEAFSQDAGRKATGELLSRNVPFSAVIAANDLVALGCIEELERNGVHCPDDVSVIGFNNMPYLDQFRVPLTTIEIPRLRMGEKAARVILERLKKPEMPLQHIVLEPRLLVRSSTARCRDA